MTLHTEPPKPGTPFDLAGTYAAHAEFKNELARVYSVVPIPSPIEFVMAAALLYAIRHPDHFAKDRKNLFLPAMPDATLEDFPPRIEPGFFIAPQVRVSGYTADFMVVAKAKRGRIVRAAVECDGHDFHERTAAQARHDRARDRYFQSCGIFILRYTGVEIREDAKRCALNALSIIDGRTRD